MRPGVTLQQAQSRLNDYGAAVSAQFPDDYPARNGWRPLLNPLQEDVVGGVATAMLVLMSGVALLLLIACVNVAHLVLARMSARRQELAVRRALGASGVQLTAQLATECAILAAAGGTLAILVASWGLRGLVALAPARVPRLDGVTLDFTAVAVTAVIAFGVTLLFASGSAVRLPRGGIFRPSRTAGAERPMGAPPVRAACSSSSRSRSRPSCWSAPGCSSGRSPAY